VPRQNRRKLDADAADVRPLRTVGERRGEPAEHLLQPHAVGQVRLRVEEDLRPPHPGRGGAGEVGAGQVVEVRLDLQYPQVGVVQVEEGLKVTEVVRGP